MTTQDKHSPEMAAMMAQWMEQASRAWKDLLQTWPVPEPPVAPDTKPGPEIKQTSEEKKAADRAQREAPFHNWRSFFEAMPGPDLTSMLSGTQSVPPAAAQLAESSWGIFADLQKSWTDQLGQAGDRNRMLDWLRPDEEAVRQWSDFYENEIRKYLTVPQIGLNKFSQENVNHMMDRFNAKQLALMEFFDLLFRPVKEGAARMQEKITEWVDEGQFPDDPKAIYRQWLKFVEGRYMKLFRSEAFLRSLQKAVATTLEFHNARKEVIEEALRYFSIPTSRDLDDVYREMHNLKQQVRAMESQLYDCTVQAASAATAG